MSRETQEKFSSYRHFTVDMERYVQEHNFADEDNPELKPAHPNSFIGVLAEGLATTKCLTGGQLLHLKGGVDITTPQDMQVQSTNDVNSTSGKGGIVNEAFSRKGLSYQSANGSTAATEYTRNKDNKISITSYHRLLKDPNKPEDFIEFALTTEFIVSQQGGLDYDDQYFGNLKPQKCKIKIEVLKPENGCFTVSEEEQEYLIEPEKGKVITNLQAHSLDIETHVGSMATWAYSPPTLWERVQEFYLQVSEWFSSLVAPEVSMISRFSEAIGSFINSVASSVLSFLGVKARQTSKEEESLEKDSVVEQQPKVGQENGVAHHQHQEVQGPPSQEQVPGQKERTTSFAEREADRDREPGPPNRAG